MAEKYLQVNHVANRLGCHRKLVYRLIQDGKLKAIKLGPRSLRISEGSYLDFIKKSEVDPLEYTK